MKKFIRSGDYSRGALDVFAHNIECVERLTPKVRDRRATYRQSLAVLRAVKEAIEEEEKR